MKKIALLCILCSCWLTSLAQVTVQGSAFLDNWTFSPTIGVMAPLKHSAFFKHLRPTYGWELSKKITTVVSLGVHGALSHNMSHSSNMVDAIQLNMVGKFNISNLMAGYVGKPRHFEIEAEAGAGWGHHFLIGADDNYPIVRCGLNFNWFVNKAYSWAIAFRPAIVCNTEGNNARSSFEGSRTALELRIGATYHFKNINNGLHHFTIQRPYNRPQVDALNAKVNGLRRQNEQLQQKVEALEQELRNSK